MEKLVVFINFYNENERTSTWATIGIYESLWCWNWKADISRKSVIYYKKAILMEI